MKYRKKPVEVEAFQLTTDVDVIAPDWFTKAVAAEEIWIDRILEDGHVRVYGCTINSQRGSQHARIGEYIIREPDGTIHACKKNVFIRDYEKAGGAA